MRIKNISKKILEGTLGVFATATDLVLFTFLMMGEVALNPADSYSMLKLQRRLGKMFFTGKDRILRNAIRNAKSKGWLKQDGKLTEEGERRLKSLLPIFLPEKRWDGKWYLVIFDVPEKMRVKRNILRDKLKTLGFGQLQESCWISPINYLANVEDVIKYYEIDPYVIFSETDKIGKETSQILAEKVWRLKEINNEYKKTILEWKKAKENKKFWLKFRYFSILKRDPQLPKELLPEDWLGEKAYKLMKI